MKTSPSKSMHIPLSWHSYYELCKPRVVALILFTVLIGMLLSIPAGETIPWQKVLIGLVGIGLAAASAAAINQYLDRKADAEMARTAHRPLPAGELEATQVIGFALSLAVLSMLILGVGTNILTAWLTFLSIIGYAVIYTVFLKRATPLNIVIGGLAGAFPPVPGSTAVTGEIGSEALLLCLIIFVWTPPHFWALAIARRDEYAKTNIPMLPVTHGVEFTQLQIVLYTILLFVVSLLPYLSGMSGIIYLISVVLLDGIFLYYALRLMRDISVAMKTFAYSIVYLTALCGVLLLDHYWP